MFKMVSGAVKTEKKQKGYLIGVLPILLTRLTIIAQKRLFIASLAQVEEQDLDSHLI